MDTTKNTEKKLIKLCIKILYERIDNNLDKINIRDDPLNAEVVYETFNIKFRTLPSYIFVKRIELMVIRSPFNSSFNGSYRKVLGVTRSTIIYRKLRRIKKEIDNDLRSKAIDKTYRHLLGSQF